MAFEIKPTALGERPISSAMRRIENPFEHHFNVVSFLSGQVGVALPLGSIYRQAGWEWPPE